MTTRRKLLIAAAVTAMLAPSAGMAQDRSQGRQMSHCEGAYDETHGTNFGVCATPEMGGEAKSPIGDAPESSGDSN
jgi:hypothetical protein